MNTYLQYFIFEISVISSLIIFYFLIIKIARYVYFKSIKKCVVQIKVPKDNNVTYQDIQSLFKVIYGIKPDNKNKIIGFLQSLLDLKIENYLSCEIVNKDNTIRFYVWHFESLKSIITSHIYSVYPEAEILEVHDYFNDIQMSKKTKINSIELRLTKNNYFPITADFNNDPLNALLSNISKKEETIIAQYIIRPADKNWIKRGIEYVESIKESGKPPKVIQFSILKNFLKILFAPIIIIYETLNFLFHHGNNKEKPRGLLTESQKIEINRISNKILEDGFYCNIRIISLSESKSNFNGVISSFNQYNNLNSFYFIQKKYHSIKKLKDRIFLEKNKFILNTEELASMYHLPLKKSKASNIECVLFRKPEIPINLPIKESEISVIGEALYRDKKVLFGIKNDDRRRHIYSVGKTGMGKTTLIKDMILSDIKEGRGVGLIDPHGDSASEILKAIPKHRINDVVYFNPCDFERPIGFNLLDVKNPDKYSLIASSVVEIFKKIFGFSWGPRMEYILRNTVLSLCYAQNVTLLGINKMFNEEKYRTKILNYVTDPILKSFWKNEYGSWNDKQKSEYVLPVINKVGQYLSSPITRNILGQVKSSFTFRDIMDNKKIFIANLSKGIIGEDFSSLLGAMIISKIQIEAMNRADIPEHEREDFYLYVDEFQNFATDSFANILSEARKYRLNLFMANQFISQLTDKIKNAVIGNCGTIISFQVGTQDAPILEKEFNSVVSIKDLTSIPKYHGYIKLMVDGEIANPFVFKTIKTDDNNKTPDYSGTIIRYSRTRYTCKKNEIEEKIERFTGE